MRLAIPFIAAAIAAGLSFAGAPGASSRGFAVVRQEAPRVAMTAMVACGTPLRAASTFEAVQQAASGARWDAVALWSGVLIGTPDNPLVAAWRGFVDHSKRRDIQLANGPDCIPGSLALL